MKAYVEHDHSGGEDRKSAYDNSCFKAFVEEANRYPILTREEEARLARTIKGGGPQDVVRKAREKLVNSNLRLVLFFVNRMRHLFPGTPIMDLIQGGSLGLIRAVDKFDVDLGYKFSTYAAAWIKQGIFRCGQYDRLVRVPGYQQTKISAINKAIAKLKQMGVHSPTEEDIAQQVGWTEDEVKEVISLITYTVSVEDTFRPKPNGDEVALEEVLCSDEGIVEDTIGSREVRELVMDAVEKTLTWREKRILLLRYGIGRNDGPASLNQIKNEVGGISRERTRQVQLQAEGKLRDVLNPDDVL